MAGVEVKASETAPYGPKQRSFDDKVNTGNHKVQSAGKKAKDAGITKIDKTTLIRCNK